MILVYKLGSKDEMTQLVDEVDNINKAKELYDENNHCFVEIKELIEKRKDDLQFSNINN